MLNAFVTLSPLATTNKFLLFASLCILAAGGNVEEGTRPGTSAGKFRSVHREQIPRERVHEFLNDILPVLLPSLPTRREKLSAGRRGSDRELFM